MKNENRSGDSNVIFTVIILQIMQEVLVVMIYGSVIRAMLSLFPKLTHN